MNGSKGNKLSANQALPRGLLYLLVHSVFQPNEDTSLELQWCHLKEFHKNLLKNHISDILGLLEIRCSGVHAASICRNMGFDFWMRIEALGYSGDIWLFWKEKLSIHILKTHPQFVHLKVQNQGGQPWLLTIVYGNPNPSLRGILWKDLNKLKLNLNAPWISAGDFNAITSAEETSNQGKLDFRRCSGFLEMDF